MKSNESIVWIIVSLFASSPTFAASSSVEYGIGFGMRQDDLRWNIAGQLDGTNPNILSELTWTDVNSIQINGFMELYLKYNLVMFADAAIGTIVNGSVQDSDYFADNRTEEFSRSTAATDNGTTGDMNIAFGYRFGSGNRRTHNGFGFIPLVGYTSNEQKLEITDGVQEINTITGETGPFNGLESSYNTKWAGVWYGVRLQYEHSKRWKIFAEYQYHDATYEATGTWNLRADLAQPISFSHEADGSGDVFVISWRFTPSRGYMLEIIGKYQQWETKPGIDRTYGAGGGTLDTRLNEVVWESKEALIRSVWFF